MGKKISCFEGIRAIGCIGVFLCHFRGAFFPQYVTCLDHTPVKILTAGNVIVRILFTLSGFVVCYKYFSKKNYENIRKDILKRYFRLAPAIIVAEIIVYFLMRAGLLYNIPAAEISGSVDFLAVFNNFTADFSGCLKEAFITCYTEGANGYIGPLWTIKYEFLGVILILSAMYICKDTYLRYIFYLIVFAFYNTYYNYFVLGMFICDIYISQDFNQFLQKHQRLNNLLFIIALYIVSLFDINDTVKYTRVMFSVGLIMLFLTLLNASWSEKILGAPIMNHMGRISYAVYIIHWPVIESFSSAYYIWATNMNIDKKTVIISCFMFSFLLIIFLAHIFNKYIEIIGKGAVLFIEKQI